MLNRLDVNDKVQATYTKTILTLIFIAAVAIGATYIRHITLENEIASAHESAINIFNDDASPFGDAGADDMGALFGDASTDDAEDDLASLFGAEATSTSTKSNAPTSKLSNEDINNQKGAMQPL